MRYLRFLLAALAVGAWAAGPLPAAVAQTAPTYQSSEPPKDAMLDEPPSEVTITFDQPLDQSSWLKVLDECGREVSAGSATIDLNEMSVDIGGTTPSGMYEVVYKAVGLAGATGSSGSSFEFMVHSGTACKGGHGGHHPPGHGKGGGDHHGGHGPGHGGHDGHDGGGHDGHGSGGMDHSMHGGMSGMSGSMTHAGHTMTMPGGHEGHMTGHEHHHGGGTPRGTGGGDPRPLAAGDTIPASADAEAVLVGLGLALAVGVLGGWLLRMSGNLSGA